MSQSNVAEILAIPARRKHNRDLALRLAEAGLFIFPSIDKSPCVARWPERAEDIPASEHDDAQFLGATRDPETIKQMWRAYPDAVPSISCGPSGVLVLDADQKKNGPANLREWAAREGVDLGKFPTTKTQSGGLHIFCKNNAGLGSAAGSFNDLGIDVRGNGGQVVAPGAVRADGRRYTHDETTPNLLDAMRSDSVPATPNAVRNAIASRGQRSESNVVELLPRELERDTEALKTESWPDFQELTDPSLGGFDLAALAAKDSEFRELRAHGDKNGDRTDARFNLAKCLAREWPQMNVREFAAILDGLNGDEGAKFGIFVDDSAPSQAGGEYNFRNLARDFARGAAQGRKTGRLTDGAALGAVEGEADEEADDESRPSDKRPKPASMYFTYAENAARDWQPVEFWLDGWIPKDGLGFMFGPSQALKSFAALDIACHLAQGWSWRGFDTEKCGSIYWCGEGRKGVDGRFKAWGQDHGVVENRVAITSHPLNLANVAQTKATIRDMVRAYNTDNDVKCGIVWLDTWRKAVRLAKGDEFEVAPIIKALDDLAVELGIAIVAVGHTGKDVERGMVGTNVYETDVGFRISVTKKGATREQRAKSKETVLVVDKQKDGAAQATVTLRQKVVEIGKNAKGRPVTSLVFERDGDPAKADCMGAVEVEVGGEAADLPSPAPAGAPERPISARDGKEAAEQALREARAHAKTAEGRKEWIVRAARSLGADGADFSPGELLDETNRLLTKDARRFASIGRQTFSPLLGELAADGALTFVGLEKQGRAARYRLQEGSCKNRA